MGERLVYYAASALPSAAILWIAVAATFAAFRRQGKPREFRGSRWFLGSWLLCLFLILALGNLGSLVASGIALTAFLFAVAFYALARFGVVRQP